MNTYKRNNITKTVRISMISLLILILVFSLSACSGSGGSGGGTSPNVGRDMASNVPMSPAPPMVSSSSEPGFVMETMEAPTAFINEADSYYEDSEMGFATDTGGSSGGSSASNVQSGRKITFSASLSINTKQFDADYRAINDLIEQSGGYVASEQTSDYTSYGYSDGRRSYFSARIPADGYDSFLDRVSEIGDVTDKNKWSDDLTAQYYDTESRIELLEIRKERLMAYLIEAEEAADIVAFERELSDVLYDLDNFQGYKRQLDRLVDFATIDISLNELITPETIGKDGEPLGERASEAFFLSSYNIGQFLEGTAIFFAGAAPVIAFLVVIAVVVWLIIRFTRPLRKKLRERREAREEERRIQFAEQQALRMKQRQQNYRPPNGQGQPAPNQPVPPAPAPNQPIPPAPPKPEAPKPEDKK